MVDYEVIKEKFVPVSSAKEILSKEEKDDLEYQQTLALEHAKKFSKLSEKDAYKLIEELQALDNRKLKDKYIVKIADILPKDMEELKVILSGSPVSFDDENLKKVLEIVKKYVK